MGAFQPDMLNEPAILNRDISPSTAGDQGLSPDRFNHSTQNCAGECMTIRQVILEANAADPIFFY